MAWKATTKAWCTWHTLGLPGTQLPKADVILTNPPFGTAKGGGGPTCDDFTYATSNKQLGSYNTLPLLKPGGRAAVVLPDNVLFEAGVGTDIRRDLMNKCNLDTIPGAHRHLLRPGVKPRVVFQQRHGNQSTPTGTVPRMFGCTTCAPTCPARQTHTVQRPASKPFEDCFHAAERSEAGGQSPFPWGTICRDAGGRAMQERLPRGPGWGGIKRNPAGVISPVTGSKPKKQIHSILPG